MKLAALLSLIVSLQGGANDDPAPNDLMSSEEADPGFIRIQNPAFPSPEIHQVPINRGPKIERADLAPYFAAGKLAGAKWAFDEGRYDKARKLLENEGDHAPVRYLRAMTLLRSSLWADAGKELEDLAEIYGPMRDRCLLQAGWAYEALKDYAASARVYEKVSAASRQFPDARLGLARCRIRLRDLAGAKAALTPFVDKPPPPWGRDIGAEALLVTADIAAAKKDAAGEKQALLQLWAMHPMSLAAGRAAGRLPSPPPATVDQQISHAEALIDAHRNLQGMAMLEPIAAALKLPDPSACRALFALGKGQRKQRLHAKAVASLAPVVKKCADPDLRARALFLLGFSRIFVEPASAAPTYETLAHEYPGHANADDALFAAAELRFKEGAQDTGMALLGEVIDHYPNGDFVAEALFKRFWILRQANDLEGANTALEQVIERFSASDDTFEVERASYWRARLLLAAGDADAAAAIYESVALEHPTTYYGVTARERLGELDPQRLAKLKEPTDVVPVDPFPVFAGPVALDQNFATAVELLRLGFGELVPTELLAIDRTALTTDSLRLMTHVLAMAGEERAAHGLARLWLKRDLTSKITPETKLLWTIAYPRAFREQVEKSATEADKLDPDLLQGLMREESALDPKALSWAGALGLTQLMPGTAAEVAGKLKLKHPTAADLFDPELNLRLGGYYLAGLLKQFKGTKQYAIASYNAGAGNVGRWRKEHPDDQLDEWVEDIPLTETRNYVKRVLRSYHTYRLLYPSSPTSGSGAGRQ
jgi:soluble lytic murein transglycosylase